MTIALARADHIAMTDTTPTPRVRPRLAASLILTRRRAGGEREVLLGRRSGAHVFMPRKYVFPGGRVDRADGYAKFANELDDEARSVLCRVVSERRARAAAAAALRETAEETGLLIAAPGEASPRPEWDVFRQQGVAPCAGSLSLVARAVTPPGRTRRFDTWFFHADAERVHGEARLQGSGELEDLRWTPLADAGALDLPIVTRFMLDELARRLDGAPEVRFARLTRRGWSVDAI